MRTFTLGFVLTALALALAATATGRPQSPAQIAGCAKANLNLLNEGRLTLGTDNPAFPPWWGGGETRKPWKTSNPYSGKGYESAVAYEVARRLGFAKREVDWVAMLWSKSFAPGKKPFDWYQAQISATKARAKAVTFSTWYYKVNQAVVGLKSNPIARVRSLAGLKRYKLGAQVGTTSYAYITNYIRPSQQPAVYDSNSDAIAALKNRQIDGIVVDFPTTGYLVGVQVPDGEGRRPASDQGDAGGLRARLPEGEPARRLREQGDPGDAKGRDTPAPRRTLARQDGRSDPEVAQRWTDTAARGSSAA